jgi:uncharacterized protein (DUF2164 family)
MPIRLKKDVEQKMIRSIRRYCSENFEEEIGELKAGLLLEFCLEEICPTVYNQAIADAQAFFQEKTGDLENSRFAIEFGYWEKHGKKGASDVQRKGSKDAREDQHEKNDEADRVTPSLPFPPSSP